MKQGNTADIIHAAVAALGPGALEEASLREHIDPLFSRVLRESEGRVYLANHSLGRPLDAMEADVREALAAWYAHLGSAWDDWGEEMQAYRARLARLLGVERADAIVPKTSAGQGLRAVLNTWNERIRVVATRGEFDSIDIILREYDQRGRIVLDLVAPREDGLFAAEDLQAAIARGPDLVVLSPVMFHTGQRLPELAQVIRAARDAGAHVMLDVYHALGVFPVDVSALDCDFAVGGSYKYLRGGPGACFLYVHARHLDGGLRTLDIGWFAKESAFDYERPHPPRYAPGGDAWLESTPAILPLYQARSGQLFTLAIGVARLREWNLAQQRELVGLLGDQGVAAYGGTDDRGAFVVIRDARARAWAAALRDDGIVVDARGEWLRLCPDVLTTRADLERAARAVRRAAGTLGR